MANPVQNRKPLPSLPASAYRREGEPEPSLRPAPEPVVHVLDLPAPIGNVRTRCGLSLDECGEGLIGKEPTCPGCLPIGASAPCEGSAREPDAGNAGVEARGSTRQRAPSGAEQERWSHDLALEKLDRTRVAAEGMLAQCQQLTAELRREAGQGNARPSYEVATRAECERLVAELDEIPRDEPEPVTQGPSGSPEFNDKPGVRR